MSITNSTLKRHKPLRSSGFKSGAQRSQPLKSKSRKKVYVFAKGAPRKNEIKKARARIRNVSKRRSVQMREYYAIQKVFIAENPLCQICVCLGKSKPNATTEIHHTQGRIGRLLCHTPLFASSCRSCRDIPHANPKWAREVGLLSSAVDWNVFPEK